jgi:thiamine-monophosphate kinase
LSLPGSSPAPGELAGERVLIERIRRRVPPAPASLVVGIGDDAAVIAPDRGALQVLTTDALVEGVHFDRRFSSWAEVGHKALAVNVSDVASMGGASRFALLSLMLPASTTTADADELLDGMLALAKETRVHLAGGNITRSPGPLVVDVTLVGSVKPRKTLTRGGGKPGDALYVTGQVGAAAAGLAWLRRHAPASAVTGARGVRPEGAELAECVERYCRPVPRARIGALLGRNRAASACMDLSDGLADAVSQLARASGTGARIDAAALPVNRAASALMGSAGEDPIVAAVAGGDDYELLFSVPRRARGRLKTVIREARGVPITCIGELTADSAIGLARDGRVEPLPAGFVHF